MERCMDNMILHDSNLKDNFKRVCQYITTRSRASITFNEEKFCFGRQQLEYLRYHLGKDSVEPSNDMLRSITEFPEPKDITGVQSWFGITNQIECFHSDWTIMLPMRPLLKADKAERSGPTDGGRSSALLLGTAGQR